MNSDLEVQVGGALRQRGWWVCAAESCTGGLVLHRLTNVPGSSAYVLGGIVAYANDIKMALLGVQPETLATHGAVSEATAVEMVQGVLARFPADLGISITGIAGPGGGTAGKPVGLTYIGVGTRTGEVRVERYVWQGDREQVKQQSADAALRLLLRIMQGA